MLFIGLIAKKKDVQSIRKDIKEKEIEIIEIKENNIENLKNIKFEEIIFLDDINLKENEYIFLKELIQNSKHLIINTDISINILRKIGIEKPIKIITFGFNSKATITISSVKENKAIIFILFIITIPPFFIIIKFLTINSYFIYKVW